MKAGDQVRATDPNQVMIMAEAELCFREIEALLNRVPGHSFTCTRRKLTPGLIDLDTATAAWLILDFQDYHVDPLQCIKQARFFRPQSAIIVISNLHDSALASRALRAGANAYLTQAESATALESAIHRIAAGERFVSEEVMQEILQGMVDTTAGENHLPVESLSDREMIVFRLIGSGKTFREIADELNVSIKTVTTHGSNIRRKLESRDNVHLIRMSRAWVANHHHETLPRQRLVPAK